MLRKAKSPELAGWEMNREAPGEGGEMARAPRKGFRDTGDLDIMMMMKTVTNFSGNDGPWRDAHRAASYK